MKKILIVLLSCQMFISGATTIFAEDETQATTTENEVISETTGSVKAGEVSETIVSFILEKPEVLVLQLTSDKVSVNVIVYDNNHNLVHDVVTDYDSETETGYAILVFDLLAGNYSIEVVGVEGEGTFDYILTREKIEEELTASPDEVVIKQSVEAANIDVIENSISAFATGIGEVLYFEMLAGGGRYIYPDGTTTNHSSSNTNIATVNSLGYVQGSGVGHTTVTYRYLGQLYQTDVLVSNVLIVGDGIVDHRKVVYMKEKFTVSLEGKLAGSPTKFSSSNPAVATVNSNGEVTTIKPGTTYIIATRGGYGDFIEVVVEKPGINETNVFLKVSQSFNLTIKGGSGKTTWKSSNTKIATINSSGKVTALAQGTVTITATRNGYAIKSKVTVGENAMTLAPAYSTVDQYPPDPYIDVIKVYYSGTTFKAVGKVVNNSAKTLVKFSSVVISLSVFETSKDIAKQKFSNISLNIAKYSSKNITFSFTSGTLMKGLDLSNTNYSIYISNMKYSYK